MRGKGRVRDVPSKALYNCDCQIYIVNQRGYCPCDSCVYKNQTTACLAGGTVYEDLSTTSLFVIG